MASALAISEKKDDFVVRGISSIIKRGRAGLIQKKCSYELLLRL